MKRTLFAAVPLLLLFAVSFAFAAETGEIQGVVFGPDGAGLPGVTIEASSSKLLGKRVTTSDMDGSFRIPLLPVGVYELNYGMDGFGTTVQRDIVVQLGGVTKLRTTMEVRLGETLEVTADQPLIDATKVDTSYRVSADDLAQSPTQARTISDIVKFTPGVMGVREDTVDGSGGGLASFRGEGEEGNNYLIDGLSVRGPRVNDPFVAVNYDAIDEVQIISDPFSPDLGHAMGGVVNTVTKTGGNTFHGQQGWLFRDKNLQAGRKEQLSIVSEPSSFSRHNWYGNIGGPIAKEQAWFFVSDNYYYDSDESEATTRQWLDIPAGNRKQKTNNILAKVTTAVADNQNLSFRLIWDEFLSQSGAIGLPETATVPDTRRYSLGVSYKGVLNPRSWMELTGGFSRENRDTKPLSGDFGPGQYFFRDIVTNTHNAESSQIAIEKLTDMQAKFYRTFNTQSMGDHELGFGLMYYKTYAEDGRNWTGTAQDPFPGNGFENGNRFVWDEPGMPATLTEYGPYGFNNTTKGVSLYVKDSVSIGRATIMGGVRTEYQKTYDDLGQEIWNWGLGDFISPRATLAVDVTNDQKNVFKFGYGMLTDTATTRVLEFFNSQGGFTYRRYDWVGPDNPTDAQLAMAGNWDFVSEQSAEQTPMTFNPDLRPNRLHNMLVEFDRRLSPDWALKTRFKYSKATKLIEDVGVFDPTTPAHYAFFLDNYEDKRRKYQSFEVEVNGRVSRKVMFNGSYVFSKAKGTNPGQFEFGPWSGTSGSGYHIGVFGDHVVYPPGDPFAFIDGLLAGLGGRGIGDEGWYGPLPYSADHAFKANIAYKAPRNFTLSTAVEARSGLHWEKHGFQDLYGDYLTFPEGRGARTTPGALYVDMSLEKGFEVKQGVIVNARVDFFNLFNSQRATSFVKEDTSEFGEIWGRQAPFQARFFFDLNW